MFRMPWSRQALTMIVSPAGRQRVRAIRARQTQVRRWSEGGLVALSVLVMVALFAIMAKRHGVLDSSRSMAQAFDVLNENILSGTRLDGNRGNRAYGACGDLCDAQGACRFVVLTDGVHNRQQVSRDYLNAAQPCH